MTGRRRSIDSSASACSNGNGLQGSAAWGRPGLLIIRPAAPPLAMPVKTDEDLFAETTMSFGEHLEELRVCLWRAVVGLMLGFFIGLAVGNWAVALIQEPLTNALEKYYSGITEDRYREE